MRNAGLYITTTPLVLKPYLENALQSKHSYYSQDISGTTILTTCIGFLSIVVSNF